MQQAHEIKRLQSEAKSKRDENEEVERLMQFQKLRQEMADNLRRLSDPSQISDTQKVLIEKVTGKTLSTMSQISAVKQKDYVNYNNEQLRIFRILNSQNES